jgi:hypothetical protein
MKRVEIIANRSVQEDILDVLEPRIPGFTYTLIPVVHGRGKNNYRLASLNRTRQERNGNSLK